MLAVFGVLLPAYRRDLTATLGRSPSSGEQAGKLCLHPPALDVDMDSTPHPSSAVLVACCCFMPPA